PHNPQLLLRSVNKLSEATSLSILQSQRQRKYNPPFLARRGSTSTIVHFDRFCPIRDLAVT
ncbi:MAG: hypothetical protein ACREQ5_31385, partial [Candidatus Dormibacteria bacterium]